MHANHAPTFVWEELEEARRGMKKDKRGSEDGVEVRDIKLLGRHALAVLANLMSKYCSPTGKENGWTKIKTWLIPKKEGTERVAELRPIACLSHMYKLMLRVVLGRIKNSFKMRFWTYGYNGGAGGEQLAFIIVEGLRRKRDWGIPFYCAKLDISAAFDSVTIPTLQKALKYHSVDHYIGCLIIREIARGQVTWTFDGVSAEGGWLKRD